MSADRAPLAVRASAAALAALALVNALPRFGNYSGDAVIHLAIAERAAAGGWFEFNPGEVSSGSTSFGWTLLESTLLHAFGWSTALRAISVVDLVALLGCGALVRHLAARAGATRGAATLAGLAFVAIPAVTYNALLGMENIVHTLAALAGVALYAQAPSDRRDLALGAAIGFGALLRPEGVALGVLPLLDVVVAWRRGASPARALRSLAVCGAVALAVYAPAVWTHHRVTGHLVPGSGVSRLMAVRREPTALHIAGPVWLYLSAALRFVVYAPVTALAAVGAAGSVDDDAARVRRACLTLFALGLALYTVGTGAAHVGRLTQWLFALLAVLLGRGVDLALSWSAGRRARSLGLAALAGAHLLLCAGETAARMRDISQRRGGFTRTQLLAHVAARPATTEAARAALCSGGCCAAGVTPTVAMVEAQLRFDYDARVRIASLDGRTSSASGADALTFDARGCPDLEAALAARSVVGVMEPPLAQLAPCRDRSTTARALTDAWGGVSPPPAGWRWVASLPGWVRVCAP